MSNYIKKEDINMPFFANNHNIDDDIMLDENFDMDAYNETCLFMELASLPYEQRKAIAESEEAAVLEAKGMIGRKTFIRLSKNDDVERRTSAAAYQMAKDKNDPLWKKLMFHMQKKNQYKEAILKKYNAKASRVAKQSQKDYLKHPAAKLLKVEDLKKTRETNK